VPAWQMVTHGQSDYNSYRLNNRIHVRAGFMH